MHIRLHFIDENGIKINLKLMLFYEQLSPEKRQFRHAVFVPAVISLFMILVFVLEKGMGWDFSSAGIMPRDVKHLWSIFTYVFIHADIGHLLNNLVSFLFLSTCLFYVYKDISYRILFWSYFVSGILLWMIGRESYHIGASGLIYSLASFLFFSGIIRKHIPLIALSLVITFLYGSMVWHVFPWKVNDPISWEGHLAGAFTGLLLAIVYRKEGPQKTEYVDDEEDDNTDDEFWKEQKPDEIDDFQ